MGLGHFALVESVPDLTPWLAAADVFLHPARLDAFPLVCLHASLAGTPVVTFRGVGGTDEMFGDDAAGPGYPDVEAMAARAGEPPGPCPGRRPGRAPGRPGPDPFDRGRVRPHPPGPPARRLRGPSWVSALVAGAGPAGWDAGTDLFLDVARRLADDPSVRFRWVGRRSRGVARWLDHDVTLLGLDGRIEWVAEPDPEDPPTVLVVPARTTEARERALRPVPMPPPSASSVRPGPVPPTPVRPAPTACPSPTRSPWPTRARVALGNRTGPEADG